jgi:hypothetical protein
MVTISKNRKRLGSQCLLKGIPPMTQLPLIRLHLLNVLPPPNGWGPSLWGAFQIQGIWEVGRGFQKPLGHKILGMLLEFSGEGKQLLRYLMKGNTKWPKILDFGKYSRQDHVRIRYQRQSQFDHSITDLKSQRSLYPSPFVFTKARMWESHGPEVGTKRVFI